MIRQDERGGVVAVVPQRLLADRLDLLEVAGELDVGVTVAPAPGLPDDVRSPLLAVLARDVVDYAGHGYRVLGIVEPDAPGRGVGWDALVAEWARWGMEPIPTLTLDPQVTAEDFRAALASWLGPGPGVGQGAGSGAGADADPDAGADTDPDADAGPDA